MPLKIIKIATFSKTLLIEELLKPFEIDAIELTGS